MRLLHASPPSCKRLPVYTETAETAKQRLGAALEVRFEGPGPRRIGPSRSHDPQQGGPDT